VRRQATPDLVAAATAAASAAGFAYASDARVGRLLAALAASVPTGGRILELGTGTGVGTAWLVSGMGDRTDVELVTVEADADLAAVAGALPWPAHVRPMTGDAVELLPGLGTFDLIFADAQGGKWERIDLTIAALAPGGILVVDDMTPQDSREHHQHEKQREVAQTLLAHADLVSVDLDWATGVILSVRRH
jgi:demethylmenaquinone methyltransferase/2-methoxy-6-polyprenyl-1,4-benzoquinol methylase